MPTQRSPWLVKIHELLADGAWHDREALVDAAMPLVPPGKAARQAAYDRARLAATRRAQGVPTIPSNGRPQDTQTVGARTKVTHSLSAATRRGHLERRTVNGVIQIRLANVKVRPHRHTPVGQ